MQKPIASQLPYLLAGVALFAAGNPAPAMAAASLLIWPIDPVIQPDRNAGALWLENQGKAPAIMQIRIFNWAQRDGKDDHRGQASIIASPPVVRIPPGARQLVRLMSTQSRRAAGETPFRIVIDEIPVAAPVSDNAVPREAGAIRFQMRYSIPLFVYGSDFRSSSSRAKPPGLRCSLLEQGGRRFVRIENEGAIHARLTNVRFERSAGSLPLAEGLLGYVLPDSAMSWPLPSETTGQELLSMAVNGNGTRVTMNRCNGG